MNYRLDISILNHHFHHLIKLSFSRNQASWSCSSYQLATAPKPGTSAARSRRFSPLSTAPSSCCARALKDSTRDSKPTTGRKTGPFNQEKLREILENVGKCRENVGKCGKNVKIWRKSGENVGRGKSREKGGKNHWETKENMGKSWKTWKHWKKTCRKSWNASNIAGCNIICQAMMFESIHPICDLSSHPQHIVNLPLDKWVCWFISHRFSIIDDDIPSFKRKHGPFGNFT